MRPQAFTAPIWHALGLEGPEQLVMTIYHVQVRQGGEAEREGWKRSLCCVGVCRCNAHVSDVSGAAKEYTGDLDDKLFCKVKGAGTFT